MYMCLRAYTHVYVYIRKICHLCTLCLKNKEGDILEEQKIESYLKKQIELIGGKAYKFISPGVSGVPDRIVIIPGGHIYFIELKAPGQKLRPIQEVRKAQLEALGCDVRVVDSKEKTDLFIEEVEVWCYDI